MKSKSKPKNKVMEAIASVLHNANDPGAAERILHFVRDYVLEEAAKVCERREGISHAFDGPLIALACARAIRAMKGTL